MKHITPDPKAKRAETATTIAANEELVATGVRKDQFITMLGHELRHGLTPITHAMYLLRKSHQDPATIELLDTIDAQTLVRTRQLEDLQRAGVIDSASVVRRAVEIAFETARAVLTTESWESTESDAAAR